MRLIAHLPGLVLSLSLSLGVNECLCLLTSLSHSLGHPFTTFLNKQHTLLLSFLLYLWAVRPAERSRGLKTFRSRSDVSALVVLIAPAVIWHPKTSNGQFGPGVLQRGPINLLHPMWQMSKNVAREVKQGGQTPVKQGSPCFIRPY